MCRTKELITLMGLCLIAAGCKIGNIGNQTDLSNEAAEPIPVQWHLDAGIQRFDGPIDPEAVEEGELFPKIREAETLYFPQQLRQAMTRSGGWRHVWVTPEMAVTDLRIDGTIITSDGSELELEIIATDATGQVWLEKTYEHEFDEEQYAEEEGRATDVLFDQIAADLLRLRDQQGVAAMKEIRAVAELKFAKSFAPQAFERYVQHEEGRDRLVALPAEDDTLYQLVLQVRERDDIFMESLQEYSTGFSEQIDRPYRDWAKHSYFEREAYSGQVTESVVQGLLSVLAIAAGAALAANNRNSGSGAQEAGLILAGAGVYGAVDAYGKYEGAEIHETALKELGRSLNVEVKPHVVQLESETYTLTGSVEEQYQQWRDILTEVYAAERGTLN